MPEKLIEKIRSSDFKAEEYGGFMFNDFQFMRLFPVDESSVSDVFNSANEFLIQNGYEGFDFNDFLEDLSVRNDKVSIYADPYITDKKGRLVLVIEKYNTNSNPIDEIILNLLRFRNERDWKQFHNPKDLALAVNVEAGELLELFLWKNVSEVNAEKVKEELADVFAFAFLLAENYNFDVKDIVLEKIKQNAVKYPADKAKGTAKKYNEL